MISSYDRKMRLESQLGMVTRDFLLRLSVSGDSIACLLAHQRKCHASQLVGSGDGDELERFGFQQLSGPVAQGITMFCLMNEQLPKAKQKFVVEMIDSVIAKAQLEAMQAG
jgi:hypothetical protein